MARLEVVRRRAMQGDDDTVAENLTCDLDEEEGTLVLRPEADVDVRPGDVLEIEELENDMIVSEVRRTRGSDGFRTEIRYRDPTAGA